MKQPTRDLFDDSTMTFGEHLEALRKHLILALIGLTVAVLVCLWKGELIVDFVRSPIDRALKIYAQPEPKTKKTGWEKMKDDWGLTTLGEYYGGFGDYFSGKTAADEDARREAAIEGHSEAILVHLSVEELVQALHQVNPGRFPLPEKPAAPEPAAPAAITPAEPVAAEPVPAPAPPAPPMVSLKLVAPEFAQFQATVEQSRRPVTLNVQEAFMTYLKVSIIAGVLLASPWIFYQLWLFVAAGLYPHERKYVYLYGTMSLVLFLVGAFFCFFAVFPFVLDFLLKFNKSLEIQPQIRLSEWISFAVVLPLMFGISFQLPLVMLFLERISIFSATVYREQRRMAILVIAILSSVLTPADPMSMLLMMFPLIFLYELGIRMCDWLPRGGSQLETV
ncbi:twin-arginine translocase subunit TatC [Planctomicrobium piriforme]|uniref:Sec-independent protein translocase protein TatC n=1 Tax=Planctomicrobium piriforme TaxID=1576369 RepID=A0A1I3HV31_9PLAN|nr:twin-arginine translocase subunit TatC [Planctomicrobium piriforme]SFI39410.1 sec-independent protein translocase protein TatC [Planctomicrobium piriforme]